MCAGEGGLLFLVSMTTMAPLLVTRYHSLPVTKFLSQSEKCLYIEQLLGGCFFNWGALRLKWRCPPALHFFSLRDPVFHVIY